MTFDENATKEDDPDSMERAEMTEKNKRERSDVCFVKVIMTSVVALVTVYSCFSMWVKYQELSLIKNNPESFVLKYTG